jgi:hypothetical protein
VGGLLYTLTSTRRDCRRCPHHSDLDVQRPILLSCASGTLDMRLVRHWVLQALAQVQDGIPRYHRLHCLGPWFLVKELHHWCPFVPSSVSVSLAQHFYPLLLLASSFSWVVHLLPALVLPSVPIPSLAVSQSQKRLLIPGQSNSAVVYLVDRLVDT